MDSFIHFTRNEGLKTKRRTTSVLFNVKERKGRSTLVKGLILAIALLIVCCLVFLNLYLVERAKNPKTRAAEKRVELPTSHSPEEQKFYGGSCWTTDCLHAASGKSVQESNLPSQVCMFLER